MGLLGPRWDPSWHRQRSVRHGRNLLDSSAHTLSALSAWSAFTLTETLSIDGCTRQVWNVLAQPLLFGLIGAAVDVRQLEAALVLRVRARLR
jgi:hypothetical protein